MANDRKKPLWPWIVTLLIGLPMLYVASFGPWCWALSRRITVDDVYPQEMSAVFYRPIYLLWWDGPHAAQEAIGWYANILANTPVEPMELGASQPTSTGDLVLDLK
jgi:hypothetical protein